jgi:itaconate CoA-transferase
LKAPLDGLLVLSLEQAVAAPYCSSRLADAGARVIKVERAEGDFARYYDRAVGSLSSYFVWLNRGKESLVADIKLADDVDLLNAILERADVFIQNLAPGAAERAGFGSEQLRVKYPRLITVDITGYGAGAAFASMKAYDLLVQAESGLAMLTGHPAGPGRVGVSVCDIACGMSAHAAVLEAIIERERTGLGKSIQVSLFDAVADWMTVPLLQYEATGHAPQRVGLAHPTICPYGAFETSDGTQILVAIQNEREWAQFCTHFLHDPSLSTRSGYQSNVARVGNRGAVDAHIAAMFTSLTRQEAERRLRVGNTAYGAVNDLAALQRHPALRRTMVSTSQGSAMIVAAPPRTGDRDRTLGAVPDLGEHTKHIRGEFLANSEA